MSTVDIYQYKDYRSILQAFLEHKEAGQWSRKTLSEAMNCQTTFISHVFSEKYELSPEQAEAATRWMKLTEEDSNYFLLLVMRARAGTVQLQKMIDRQIDMSIRKNDTLKKRLNLNQNNLTLDNQLRYYSDWIYSTVHMASMIPKLQDIENLRNYLSISKELMQQTLDFLNEVGLVEIRNGKVYNKQPIIYLDPSSPAIRNHHSNWRLKAISQIHQQKESSLHYSSVLVLSKESFFEIRNNIVQFLKNTAKQIEHSENEEIASLNIDFFQL